MFLSKRKKLEDLPDEVILKIFSFLDLKDILRCGQMSKNSSNIQRPIIVVEEFAEDWCLMSSLKKQFKMDVNT